MSFFYDQLFISYVCLYGSTMRSGLVNPEEEDSVCEAMEQLRINYNLRQWRVCALLCDSLADKFKSLAEKERGK